MRARYAAALLLGAAFLALIALIVIPAVPAPAVPGPVMAAGPALWKGRTYEALLQGMIILAGVLSILLLLGGRPSGGMPP